MAANPEITADTTETTSAATTPDADVLARLRSALDRLNSQQKLMLAVAVAAMFAILAGAYLWGRQPDYRVLFANFSEQDGSAIINALDQANVPYRYSESGTAILVPAAQVHDARLRLAGQGLPRGGSIGFELMEAQKFGASQFIEQVNYQRALEGELARTIASISAVQSARVHLASPKPSVFVREEQKPTASVLLRLYPGRVLEGAQVAGISHLIASSVPQLPLSNVNIIDQNGNLLSQLKDKLVEAGLDPTQLKYVRDVENSIIERIQNILTPVLGEGNYRAQVAADLDFSHVEQTAETFAPNADRANASIRSEQVSESASLNEQPPGGIPGALTNQPPVPATAPLSQPPVTPPAGEAGGPAATPPNPRDPNKGQVDAAGVYAPLNPVSPPLATQKGVTTNYEVDKTIRYTRQSAGAVRRLTAAVVVNYRMIKDRSGAEKPGPLPEEEIEKIRNLAREAMGYNEARGDSLSIANVSFTAEARTASEGLPLWKDPETVARGMDILKYVVIAGILFAIYFVMLRPVLRAMRPPEAVAADAADSRDRNDSSGFRVDDGEGASEELNSFAAKIGKAKELAQGDPKVVANMIKDWMGLN
jgi:flagellar M-ring protein FliF